MEKGSVINDLLGNAGLDPKCTSEIIGFMGVTFRLYMGIVTDGGGGVSPALSSHSGSTEEIGYTESNPLVT